MKVKLRFGLVWFWFWFIVYQSDMVHSTNVFMGSKKVITAALQGLSAIDVKTSFKQEKRIH